MRNAQAAERLRKEFNKPLSIEGLAKDLGMSSSGFHHHFKTVMDMSPLQFQKQIRLQEARQVMLGESLDAASAGYCKTVMAMPEMQQWVKAAQAEPEEIDELDMDF